MSLLSVHQEETRNIFVRTHQHPRQQRKIVIAQLLLLAVVAHNEKRKVFGFRLHFVLLDDKTDDLLCAEQRRGVNAHLRTGRRREKRRLAIVVMTIYGAAAL